MTTEFLLNTYTLLFPLLVNLCTVSTHIGSLLRRAAELDLPKDFASSQESDLRQVGLRRQICPKSNSLQNGSVHLPKLPAAG